MKAMAMFKPGSPVREVCALGRKLGWKRIEAWGAWAAARRVVSRMKAAGWLAWDISAYLLVIGNGACAMDAFSHGKWQGWINAVVALALGTALTFRNYWMWRRGESQKEYIATLREVNNRLQTVALSAVAMKICLEHGLPAGRVMDELNRNLDAVLHIEKVEIHPLPSSPQARGPMLGDPGPLDPSKMN